MSDVEITLKLPEELVERARAAGIQIDNVTDEVIELLEKRIKRKIAQGNLLTIIDQINQLPDELKPTPDEINEEIRAYWAEKANSNNTETS